MKWHAQVLHVARKDARMIRWLILAHVVVVALLVASALHMRGAVDPGPLILLPLLVPGLLAGLVVIADSPARADAFWATRPLHPLAVFAAKLLTGGLLAAIPLAGGAVLIALHDVPAGEAGRLLPGVAATHATLLSTAVLIAALSRRYGAFLAAAVLFVVLLGVTRYIIFMMLPPEGPLGSRSGPATLVLALGGALLVAGWQYRTRDARRGVALAGGVLLLLTLVPPLAGHVIARRDLTRVPESAATPHVLRAELDPAGALMVLLVWNGAAGESERFRGNLHDGVIVTGTDTAVLLRQTDGSRVQVTSFPVGPDAAALPRGSRAEAVTLRLRPTERGFMDAADARIVFRGTIERIGTRRFEVPAREGAHSVAAGTRLRVVRVELTSGLPEVALYRSTVGSTTGYRGLVAELLLGDTSALTVRLNPYGSRASWLPALTGEGTAGILRFGADASTPVELPYGRASLDSATLRLEQQVVLEVQRFTVEVDARRVQRVERLSAGTELRQLRGSAVLPFP